MNDQTRTYVGAVACIVAVGWDLASMLTGLNYLMFGMLPSLLVLIFVVTDKQWPGWWRRNQFRISDILNIPTPRNVRLVYENGLILPVDLRHRGIGQRGNHEWAVEAPDIPGTQWARIIYDECPRGADIVVIQRRKDTT